MRTTTRWGLMRCRASRVEAQLDRSVDPARQVLDQKVGAGDQLDGQRQSSAYARSTVTPRFPALRYSKSPALESGRCRRRVPSDEADPRLATRSCTRPRRGRRAASCSKAPAISVPSSTTRNPASGPLTQEPRLPWVPCTLAAPSNLPHGRCRSARSRRMERRRQWCR